MQIKKLYVKNFRNIKEAEFIFHEKMNIFCGNNAQGKTNLCEAISLCMGPSFRNSKVSSLIPFSLENTSEKTEIAIEFTTDNNTDSINTIKFTVCNNKKEITYNNFRFKDAMELYGLLKYVVFIPEHLNLIKGIPQQRRDYLDSVAMMQTPVHLKKLSRYNKALKNKNNILCGITQFTEMQQLKAQLESWNTILAAEGLNVSYGRLKYFDMLQKTAAEIYAGLSGGEALSMSYYSNIFDRLDLQADEVKDLYEDYLGVLNADFEKELKMRYTVSGVHRDDINFYINGKEAREFGSQGQQRSTALVLKLAEAQIIRKRHESPIMILDDVLSELDASRADFILHNIVNSQCFITCCNINDIRDSGAGSIWRVENGSFKKYRRG